MFVKINQPRSPKRLKKLILQAKKPELNHLKRRAKEIFPRAEIICEASEEFLAYNQLPAFSQLKSVQEKFNQIKSPGREQGYFLLKDKENFYLGAESGSGLFYGLLSLKELVDAGEEKAEIIDAPAFPHRGFLQDLSRGQVLNLSGFERLIKALALFRYNFLTFNLEHNFQSRHYPDLAPDDDQLLQEEARALAQLAREHFIEIIPMQQSLGHLRGILTKPRYRHLAFDQELLWSLDPRNEDSHLLLADLYAEQCEVFPGKYFLVGCDEPFDLKKRIIAQLNQEKEFEKLYLEHILALYDILRGLKRTMMLWGDVLLAHPCLIDQLPEDVIILNWQYGTDLLEPEEYYQERSQPFLERGRKFYPAVCTWSLGRIFPELTTARANIRNFLGLAKKENCPGALLTNWGDLGHLQLLGWIVLPLAYFGWQSWKKDIEESEFDQQFSEYFFRDEKARVIKLFQLLDQVNDLIKVAPGMGGMGLSVFFDELLSKNYLPLGPIKDRGEKLMKTALEAGEIFFQLLSDQGLANREWLFDLEPPLIALRILARKLLIKELAPFSFKNPSKKEELEKEVEMLIFQTEEFESALSERWRAQAKPKGLKRLKDKISRVELGYLKRLRQIQRGQARSWKEFRDSSEFVPFQFNLLREMGLEGLL